MFTLKRLYFCALILIVVFAGFNLLHLKNVRSLYSKNYSTLSYEKMLNLPFGKYFSSNVVYNSTSVNLTEDAIAHQDDNTIAETLKKQVRVFIWVMTAPKYHKTRAKAVRDTWGKHCDNLVFFSTEDDPELPAIALNVSESYENLTPKTRMAFRYLYENHFNDADWFMKVDDDTFVIVENLRYFLSEKNPNEPLYFGHHFQAYIKKGYHSGGAGYVISKEALRRFGQSENSSHACAFEGWAEDLEFGKCMQKLNVTIEDSRDALGRSRFNCLNVKTHLLGLFPDWYYKLDAHEAKKGISDYAITFHYIPSDDMYTLEFLVYHMRPYGILESLQNLNRH